MLAEMALTIETAVLQAWPAAVVVDLDGWKLRFNQGVTGRANSVWPNSDDGRLSLETKIEQAEAFYRYYNLPVRFQLGPATQPSHLDDVLHARGYEFYSPTHVQTAVLDQITAPAGHAVTLTGAATAAWLACHQRVNGYEDATLEVRAAIMARVAAPKAFASAAVNDCVVGIGFGVCVDGWLGLFCVETQPDMRRRGVATAVLAALTRWAKTQNAARAYLQVTTKNQAAIALYGRCGFTTAYTYHYRRLVWGRAGS